MRNIKDVLRLKYVGKLSHERIAMALGVSKGVVTKYAGLANAAGLTWELIQPMDETQLHNRLINYVAQQSAIVLPNYGVVHQELRRKGMTLMLLWEEHVEQHGQDHTHRYAQFCVHYRAYAKSLKRTMRQVHRAGEKLFIDFAGSTVGLRNGDRAHIFVAALGASGYTFAYATPQRNHGRLVGCHSQGTDLLWWCHAAHRAR
jgi:transposase